MPVIGGLLYIIMIVAFIFLIKGGKYFLFSVEFKGERRNEMSGAITLGGYSDKKHSRRA